MATETTKDAVIVVPSEQQQNIQVSENAAGTAVAFQQPTTNAEVVVTGNVVSTGSTVKDSTFTFTEQGSLTFQNKVVSSSINATIGNDSIAFGEKSKSVKADLGLGSDSVAFGGGSTIKDTKISLGVDDGTQDVVAIDKAKDVKSLKVTNFGKEDKLIVNGQTFSAKDLKNGNSPSDNITIKFN